MGKYDARIKQTQGLAAKAIGQTIIIAGTSYDCLASDFETRDQLTEAGIKRSRSLDIVVNESLFDTLPAIGTLGTYNGTVIRMTDTQTKSATGGLIRMTWEAR